MEVDKTQQQHVDLIGYRNDLAPRLLQLSHMYRTRQYISADFLRHAIDGSQPDKILPLAEQQGFRGDVVSFEVRSY